RGAHQGGPGPDRGRGAASGGRALRRGRDAFREPLANLWRAGNLRGAEGAVRLAVAARPAVAHAGAMGKLQGCVTGLRRSWQSSHALLLLPVLLIVVIAVADLRAPKDIHLGPALVIAP